jgi:hypothetical protein
VELIGLGEDVLGGARWGWWGWVGLGWVGHGAMLYGTGGVG